MSVSTIPWHHKDSDYVPRETLIPKTRLLKLVYESKIPVQSKPSDQVIPRAVLKEDPFVFGDKPFEN
jgi:hypothetical protein